MSVECTVGTYEIEGDSVDCTVGLPLLLGWFEVEGGIVGFIEKLGLLEGNSDGMEVPEGECVGSTVGLSHVPSLSSMLFAVKMISSHQSLC